MNSTKEKKEFRIRKYTRIQKKATCKECLKWKPDKFQIDRVKHRISYARRIKRADYKTVECCNNCSFVHLGDDCEIWCERGVGNDFDGICKYYKQF